MSVKILIAAMVLLAADPALATEPQVGRWSADPQHCTGASSLTVTPTTVQRASEFCTIGKMYKADRALYIEGRCSNGGLMTRHPITLAMKGERLAVTWNGEHIEMQRCP